MRHDVRHWWLICAVSCVALLAAGPVPLAAQEGAEGRKLALLVGVKEYDDARLHTLGFAENDVEELAEVLRGYGYQVVLLTTKLGATNSQQKPTVENISRQLDALLKKVTKRDLVLVGLAGHGLQPLGSDQSYFCPMDANPTTKPGLGKEPGMVTRPETLISIGGLLQTLDDSGIGRKLLLVDACRNDPGARGRRGVDKVKVSALPSETGVLLSCSAGEYAFEHKSWGKAGHGAFFAAVIEGIQGQAADKRNVVTWDGLSVYVREQVPGMVTKVYGEDGGQQSPNQITNISGAPVMLARVKSAEVSSVPNRTSGSKPGSVKTTPVGPLAWPCTTEEAQAGQAAWARSFGKQVVEQNTIGMDFVLIPPGTFTMGSPADEAGHSNDQSQVSVTLTKPFWLGRTEVTQGQWKSVMGTEPWKGKEYVKDGADCPAIYVSWEDAREFCQKLSQKEGRAYRLPTEAEWEWSCRAGSREAYGFGSRAGDLGRYAWYEANADKVKEEYAHRVGQKLPNGFGLSDMHGNVWEWCTDVYVDKLSGGRDPLASEGGSSRVFRSGSWYFAPAYCRSASRSRSDPSIRSSFLGFRPVLSASVQ